MNYSETEEVFKPFESKRLDTILNRTKMLLSETLIKVTALTDEEILEREFLKTKKIFIEKPALALGLETAKFAENWNYFITICFPTKHLFEIKHKVLLPGNRSKYAFNKIKYGDCTMDEQYEFIVRILDKHMVAIAPYYDIFFEQTAIGNLHIHGRIAFDTKPTCMKTLKIMFCQIFGLSFTEYPRFVDIKKYDALKWNDYQQKEAGKAFQITTYPNYSNIIR